MGERSLARECGLRDFDSSEFLLDGVVLAPLGIEVHLIKAALNRHVSKTSLQPLARASFFGFPWAKAETISFCTRGSGPLATIVCRICRDGNGTPWEYRDFTLYADQAQTVENWFSTTHRGFRIEVTNCRGITDGQKLILRLEGAQITDQVQKAINIQQAPSMPMIIPEQPQRSFYPRLLIIDSIPVGSASATGQIKQLFIDGWPEDRLLQVYQGAEALSLKRWPRNDNMVGVLTESDLLAACRRFGPDVIYFRPVDSEGLFNFAEQLVTELSMPLVIHMMDDWPERLKANDAETFAKLDSMLRHLLSLASVRLSICQKMSDVYLKRYGHEFLPLANGVDLAEIPPKDWSLRTTVTEQRPFLIRYMGGMADDMNFDSVADIARTVSTLSHHLPVRLEIYTMSWYLEKTKSVVSGLRAVQVAELVPAQDYRKTLSEADALLIAYNFDAATIRYMSLSMANKLPEVLASGAAVIAYGPTSIATIAYLDNVRCARTITTRNSELLSKEIADLATNLDVCRELGIVGRDHVGRFMSKSLVKERFRQEMTKAARSINGVTRPSLRSYSSVDRSRYLAASTKPGTSQGEKQHMAQAQAPVPSSAVVPIPKPDMSSPAIARPKPTFVSRLSVEMGQSIEGINWSNPVRVNGTSARRVASGQRATMVLSLKREHALLLLLALPPRSSREQYDGVRLEIDGTVVSHTLHLDIDPPCLVANVPVRQAPQHHITELAILVPSRTEPQGNTDGKDTGFAVAKVSVIPAFPANQARALTIGKSWYQRLAGRLKKEPLAFPFSHFDGLAYVAANPDVAENILGGRLSSGLRHYQKYGRSEGRACAIALKRNPNIGGLGEIFDGQAYLETYSDIAEAVRNGTRSSALEHYVQYGRSEGRRAKLRLDGSARRGTAVELVEFETLRATKAMTDAIRDSISKEVGKQVGQVNSELTRSTSVLQSKLDQVTKEQSAHQTQEAARVAANLAHTAEELRGELARVTKEQTAQQAARAARTAKGLQGKRDRVPKGQRAKQVAQSADRQRGKQARVTKEQKAKQAAQVARTADGLRGKRARVTKAQSAKPTTRVARIAAGLRGKRARVTKAQSAKQATRTAIQITAVRRRKRQK